MKTSLILLLLSSGVFAQNNFQSELMSIAEKRNLGADDILAAAKTYTPYGMKDEYLCINSGGQASSAILYGVPSMRIYKYVPTAAHDPVTGYMHELNTKNMVRRVSIDKNIEYTWADTHHPSFSETNGMYDGEYAFLNDKANPRIFVIDLKDFETKQIIHNPLFMSDHGGAFVTPNSEYIVEGAQYPAPIGREYVELNQDNFNKYYRGGITYHKFDRKSGKIIEDKSFTVLAPPYSQDLSDAGKEESYGYSFTNSFCAERYIGAVKNNNSLSYEAGCSTNDTDFMHILNWKRAEELIKEGKFEIINNHKVITLETAAKEGVLFLVPEPKSPHGVDVTPDGRFITIAGKLDTHASVFDFRKMKELMDKKEFASFDDYGIPILDMKKSLHTQVQVGLGPLHNQYDKKEGIVYTSLYLDSQVVKWDYITGKVLDKVSINYNIGHLVSMQGDSRDPRGKYVISLNKLALDRFDEVGPLLPQNHQLIDVSGEKMKVIYDLPLPMGEPHYTVCVDINTLKPIKTYPVGTDIVTMKKSPFMTLKGEEKIKKTNKKIEVFGTLTKEGITPSEIKVNQGEEIILRLTNLIEEEGEIIKVNVNGISSLGIFRPGETSSIRFVASQSGVFNIEVQNLKSPILPKNQGKLFVSKNNDFEKQRVEAVKLDREYNIALFTPPKIEKVKDKAEVPGLASFNKYGCMACHQIGKEVSGPNLAGIVNKKSDKWLREWIKNPESKYEEKDVVELINKFGVKMPNLEVTDEDLDEIMLYLHHYKD